MVEHNNYDTDFTFFFLFAHHSIAAESYECLCFSCDDAMMFDTNKCKKISVCTCDIFLEWSVARIVDSKEEHFLIISISFRLFVFVLVLVLILDHVESFGNKNCKYIKKNIALHNDCNDANINIIYYRYHQFQQY